MSTTCVCATLKLLAVASLCSRQPSTGSVTASPAATLRLCAPASPPRGKAMYSRCAAADLAAGEPRARLTATRRVVQYLDAGLVKSEDRAALAADVRAPPRPIYAHSPL